VKNKSGFSVSRLAGQAGSGCLHFLIPAVLFAVEFSLSAAAVDVNAGSFSCCHLLPEQGVHSPALIGEQASDGESGSTCGLYCQSNPSNRSFRTKSLPDGNPLCRMGDWVSFDKLSENIFPVDSIYNASQYKNNLFVRAGPKLNFGQVNRSNKKFNFCEKV